MKLADARRIALAAQGFGRTKTMREAIDRLAVIQMDSVNVLVRAHYMPVFSRIGPYDRTKLEKQAYHAPRGLFEYWGHEASLLPVRLHPLFRFRMAQALRGERMWGNIARFGREKKAYCDDVLAMVRDRGPLRASELVTDVNKKKGRWWSRSEPKIALEWLFWTGQVTTSGRRHFERIYDLPERVLPAGVLAMPTPSAEDAQRELLRISARALGVATKDDLRDYFRLAPCDALVRDLVENGDIEEVSVEGWNKPAYRAKGARVAKVDVAALLSPFDPLIWFRARAHRLFDFHYRIEIYTPEAQRKHGYYVLPFLLGDRLVARVDLKRDEGVLQVASAHLETHVTPDEVAPPLANELRAMAEWLGLESVRVARKGKLASALASAVRGSPPPTRPPHP